MPVEWSVTTELSKADMTQVFSGGACNVLNEKGKLLRNQERDNINDWLTSKKSPSLIRKSTPARTAWSIAFRNIIRWKSPRARPPR